MEGTDSRVLEFLTAASKPMQTLEASKTDPTHQMDWDELATLCATQDPSVQQCIFKAAKSMHSADLEVLELQDKQATLALPDAIASSAKISVSLKASVKLKEHETTKQLSNELALLVSTFQTQATELFLTWNKFKLKNAVDGLEDCLLAHILAICKAFAQISTPQHSFMARMTDPRIEVVTTSEPKEPGTALCDKIAAYAVLLILCSEEAFALVWWSFSKSREHLLRTATSTLPLLRQLLHHPSPTVASASSPTINNNDDSVLNPVIPTIVKTTLFGMTEFIKPSSTTLVAALNIAKQVKAIVWHLTIVRKMRLYRHTSVVYAAQQRDKFLIRNEAISATQTVQQLLAQTKMEPALFHSMYNGMKNEQHRKLKASLSHHMTRLHNKSVAQLLPAGSTPQPDPIDPSLTKMVPSEDSAQLNPAIAKNGRGTATGKRKPPPFHAKKYKGYQGKRHQKDRKTPHA